jgi:uncharacterized membrane protein
MIDVNMANVLFTDIEPLPYSIILFMRFVKSFPLFFIGYLQYIGISGVVKGKRKALLRQSHVWIKA